MILIFLALKTKAKVREEACWVKQKDFYCCLVDMASRPGFRKAFIQYLEDEIERRLAELSEINTALKCIYLKTFTKSKISENFVSSLYFFLIEYPIQ